MQSVIVSLVAILAATSIAIPVAEMSSRQLGSLTAPLTGILSQVSSHIPTTINGNGAKTNGTKPKSSDPLSSLTGVTGGLGV
ncbi:hypothetical protein F5Y03DRAFT_394640 [Xylaria venustula]|nr:hypothetical protein F5Y03DRAFT_394640 [Xylaria venustula]